MHQHCGWWAGGPVRRIQNPTESELREIRRIAGESFAGDELFRELGEGAERTERIMVYMSHYVDYCVACGMLFGNDEDNGFVAISDSRSEHPLATARLFRKLKRALPRREYRALNAFSEQVATPPLPYAGYAHLEMLMLCVDAPQRGRGLGRELVEYSQSMADREGLPLLVDTDMPGNCEMYQHLGCELYNTTTAKNGVTRYNLVYKPWD